MHITTLASFSLLFGHWQRLFYNTVSLDVTASKRTSLMPTVGARMWTAPAPIVMDPSASATEMTTCVPSPLPSTGAPSAPRLRGGGEEA